MAATAFLRFRLALKARLLRLLYFKTEQRLLRGQPVSSLDKPAFVFLTVHKAASSLLSIRLAPFFKRHGYAVADISSYFAKTGLHRRETFLKSETQRKNVFGQRGVFHCAFRFYVELPHPEQLQILLVLRDPRDVLVSHYFSTRYSHPVLNPEFYVLKEKAEKLSIDEYVLFIAPDFLERYRRYRAMISKPNVLFLRYEDLVADPKKFEERLQEFTGLSLNPGEIVSPADFVQEQENPFAHKRKVTPGDHREKLKPETIAKLNEIFAGELAALNYSA